MRPPAWLSLLRPPNLLTVPGDVWAGFFLATGPAVAVGVPGLLPLTGASLCFYAGGLLVNDWVDAEEDGRERPARPIPSGAVGRKVVLGAGAGLFLLGLLLCATQGWMVAGAGLALVVAVLNYNLLAKPFFLVGAAAMGLCRALNVFLGAALVSGFALSPLAAWGVAATGFYIAAVTHLARKETGGRYGPVERWLPAGALVLAFFTYLPLSPLLEKPGQIAVPLLFLLLAGAAGRSALLLPGGGSVVGAAAPVPALIGRLIALLLPLQATFILASGDEGWRWAVAFVILSLWPLKRGMGRWFYSS